MELREDWTKTYDLHSEHGRGDPFAAAVRWTRMPMVFTDPRKIDCPIVYANAAFCSLTGYDIDEIVGRNCRFLQGPETDRGAVLRIRQALANKSAVGLDILNYRKDGSTFWNALFISPVFNNDGELTYFFSSQFDATQRLQEQLAVLERKRELENEVGARTRDLEGTLSRLKNVIEEKELLINEIDHRVKNNLQTISTLISIRSRSTDTTTRAALVSLQDRVDALGAVHRKLYNNGSALTFDLAELIRELAPEIIRGHARNPVKLHTELEPALLENKSATPISLIVNELITNAVRHAWNAGAAGELTIKTEVKSREALMTVTDDGIGFGTPVASRPMSGLRLSEALIRQLRGTIKWLPVQRGTSVQVSVPLP